MNDFKLIDEIAEFDRQYAKIKAIKQVSHIITKEFNLNYYVYVKLTNIGYDELKRQHAEIFIDPRSRPPCPMRDEDADGWSKWQLHELFLRFGHMMLNGFHLPFEPTIRLSSGDEL